MEKTLGKKFDVLFFEAFAEEEASLREKLPDNLKVWFTEKTIQECDQEVAAPIISIRTQSRIPELWNVHLKGVLSRSTGYDHLLYTLEGTPLKIKKGYLPIYCARAVAEHALMMCMNLLAHYSKQSKQTLDFNRNHITGREIFEKKVFVIGVGQIGGQFVKMAKGLDCEVKGFDSDHRLSDLAYITLDEGIQWADIIVCTLSLNDETKGLLSYDRLSSSKKGILLVNVSRGEITPMRDLDRLLENGQLAGLGLDVYESENEVASNLRGEISSQLEEVELLKKWSSLDHVILTPHNAFNKLEALERKCSQSVESIDEFIKTGAFKWSVAEENF